WDLAIDFHALAEGMTKKLKPKRHQTHKVVPVDRCDLAKCNEQNYIDGREDPEIGGDLHWYEVAHGFPRGQCWRQFVESQYCKIRKNAGRNRTQVYVVKNRPDGVPHVITMERNQ